MTTVSVLSKRIEYGISNCAENYFLLDRHLALCCVTPPKNKTKFRRLCISAFVCARGIETEKAICLVDKIVTSIYYLEF